ncbi:sugar-binding transcriptional regulator [Roseobacter denitrificans]|nr:sugar-binding transcriptional regulator [Roseobacter denitrificans]AVL52461.1 sugar-binding transcriptional regulator [Roseobacter denitrificans]SFG08111.1 dihydroxyacetone kinase [Roseobacter denitrificans OCh 114]
MKRMKKPVEFSDAAVWAAWLYYVDELTQKEIADRLGTSRVTVIKLLAEAKERGLVKIEIDTTVASHVALSRQMADRFGLQEALIIPSLKDGDDLKRLGRAASMMLVGSLKDGETLAVAWGRTVAAVAQSVPGHTRVNDITVCQLVASPDGMASDFSPELCSSLLANRLGAKCVNILAPAVVSNAGVRASLMAEPSIAAQFEVIRNASTALFGVGELGAGSTISTHNVHKPETLSAVEADGALAVIMGLFIDADGNEVRSAVHDRLIGATLENLHAIPRRICVAGGLHKTAAIRAALRGNLATHLVIDEATAQNVLRSDVSDQPG